jgi:E3 ubiquitin-protein ligase MARCH6
MLVGGLRTALVGCVWLGVVPWLIRWVWRWFFWMADAAWAREAFTQTMLRSSASASVSEPLSNSERMANAFHQYFPSMNSDLKNIVFRQNASAGTAPTHASVTTNTTNSFTWPRADPSILSPWTYLASLTPNARLNRLILDVFEGQLITCLIITGFILVFLIREWVVQQQPLVNLDNIQRDLREATERMQADNERLRRQTELLEQARARLAELQQETEDYLASPAGAAGGEGRTDVQFMGWEALETLMDNATKHLRTGGETEHAQFVSNALTAMMQIRKAASAGVGLPGVDGVEGLSEKVSQKLASLSAEERDEWKAVLVSAIKKAQQNQATPSSTTEPQLELDEETIEPDTEWVSRLAKTANALRKTDDLKTGEEVDEVELPNGQNDAEATPAAASETPATRPPMPDRDISSRATQIQRIIAEAEEILASQNENNSASASASHEDVEPSSDIHRGVYSAATSNAGNAGRLGVSSVSSPDKSLPGATMWDHRKTPIPIINAGPDAKINIRWSGTSRAPSGLRIQETMLEVDEKLLELKDEVARETEQDRIQASSADNNPFHPDGPDPEPRDNDTLGNRVASVFREEFGLEDAADADEPHQMELDAEPENPNTVPEPQDPPPQHTARPQPTYWERLADWFWGDIQTPAAAEPVPVAEEERIPDDGANTAQVAPFTPARDSQPAPEPAATAPEPAPQDPEPAHQNDPEVVAAAQQAGIDPEAIEDAEDLEGIFELIGLQGPLIGLFQTSAFCLLLVACTILGAVILPYLGGKVALSLAGSPVYFLIQMPLRAASFVVDAAIDVTLLVAGAVVVTIAFAVDFVLSAGQTWTPSIEGILLPEKVIAYCTATMATSAYRLRSLFPSAESADGWAWGWAFLRWSVHAHSSLRNIQDEVNAVLQFVGAVITRIVETVSSDSVLAVCNDALTRMMDVPAVSASIFTGWAWCQECMKPLFDVFAGIIRGTLTFSTSDVPLDPSLVYWNSTDRALAIFTGYSALAALAAIYVAADTPITKSESGRKTEKMIRDTLRQAGGVLKVILIISIEMLVFPLYCGLLLDVAFLPLFKNADVASRWAFAVRKPSTFCFVHWFVGTCYMFHFALFVGMCRKILRKGVLWFIRDPDDPTFHPVRDVLERNVTTQLRKIAFSALVYGALVICCLGGVIWSIGHVFDEIFPITWFTTEPILEFPMDMLLYNFLTPIIIRLFKPSDAVNTIYAWWLRRCARALRLSHFLFDDRRKDEEGRFVHKSWRSFFLVKRPDHSENLLLEDESHCIDFKKDGMYVLTPCNDQYRPPKPDEAFFHLDDDACIVDKDGKKNDHFAKIYIPPLFRIRISLFMVCLWLFSAFMGLCSTLLPLVLGRYLLARLLPEGMRVSDIYAYSLGCYILGGGVMVAAKGRSLLSSLQKKAAVVDVNAWLDPLWRFAIKALRCVYVYGFLGIMLPTIFALFLQLYVVLPLHTWSASAALSTASNATDPWSSDNTSTAATNLTQPSAQNADGSRGSLVEHSFHVFSDYTLGLLYVSPQSLPMPKVTRRHMMSVLDIDGFHANLSAGPRLLQDDSFRTNVSRRRGFPPSHCRRLPQSKHQTRDPLLRPPSHHRSSISPATPTTRGEERTACPANLSGGCGVG